MEPDHGRAAAHAAAPATIDAAGVGHATDATGRQAKAGNGRERGPERTRGRDGMGREDERRAAARAAAVAAVDSIRRRHRAPEETRKSRMLYRAAEALLRALEAGTRIERKLLRTTLETAFGATDAAGHWSWKDGYEAAEVAVGMLVLRYSRALKLWEKDWGAGLARIRRIEALEPPQTRRSEEQVLLQQFSTPLALAYAAGRAARLRGDDIVLEPSAGTGMLAVMAAPQLRSAEDGRLVLNELAADRAALLQHLLPASPVTRHNAEAISDRLPEARPSVVLMNPPFSRSPGFDRMRRDADLMHVRAAYLALAPGGRLVTITSHAMEPGNTGWKRAFRHAATEPVVRLTVRLNGALYQSRGTTFSVRLTVIDRPAPGTVAPESAADDGTVIETAEALIEYLAATVPPRLRLGTPEAARTRRPVLPARKRAGRRHEAPQRIHDWGETGPLEYDSLVERKEQRADGRPYEPWTAGAVLVEDAVPHPTKLVQSAAMNAVAHRRPTARPVLPAAVVGDGKLSDAQLESVVLAADAHGKHLPGLYQISDSYEKLRWLMTRIDPKTGREEIETVTENEDEDFGVQWHQPVTIRQGWMLGDGTGTGKGRQVAGIILDQWLKGRRRALWLSQSDKLVEDARRDWTALGGYDGDVIELTRIRQKDPIPHSCGILFCTYAALRSRSKSGSHNRLDQIVQWLAGGSTNQARVSFDGVIVFDEAHAMQHAAGDESDRGRKRPSQQGLAGLRLQNALPDARVVYVSATGASTLEGLAYAQRLGLWMSERTAFRTRKQFIEAMDAGGVAAMEIVARDLKSFGLYQARALSYDGIEIDILTHDLTAEQRETYDKYAFAFRIIHTNIAQALHATNVVGDEGETKSKETKAIANGLFESAKQRFFGHLLTSMKVPSLIRAIEEDQRQERASVVQLVSTGEALTERRLAEIPVEEWDDLRVDVTPREYMIEYLRHGFPTTLHRSITNENGDEISIPVTDENGNAVESQEAVAMRDALIEELSALPPLGSALDQLVQHFGHEAVAEISGRTRRIVKVDDGSGERMALRRRSGNANSQETRDFMDGRKRILVFSGAGNTGRSYHADLACANTAKRIHYLLEPGWRADQAIQGLGRTHRTHQKTAPLFRPVTTDVKGERRFISTIARRLDALGAITRGQRDSQTTMGADRKLFRAADNFESPYARAALRQFYLALHAKRIPRWNTGRFHKATGLDLLDKRKQLRNNLPEMPKFLNRILALPIGEQNELFGELETRIEANIEQAIEKGTFNQGVETIRADELAATSREVACTHAGTDSDTTIVEIHQKDRIRPLEADEAIRIRDREHEEGRPATLIVNRKSGNAALGITAPVAVLDDGGIQRRTRLVRPMSRDTLPESTLRQSHWHKAAEPGWRRAWEGERKNLGTFRESRFWLVTGVLLPIWKMLAGSDFKVYRLTTNDGEELLGRVLTGSELTSLREKLGLGAEDAPELSGTEVYDEAMRKGSTFQLAAGWRIIARRHMGRRRLEIEGPVHRDMAGLRSLGCRTEIVAHQTRIWAPSPEVLEQVLERYPLARSKAR